jgi:hypothetical protein
VESGGDGGRGPVHRGFGGGSRARWRAARANARGGAGRPGRQQDRPFGRSTSCGPKKPPNGLYCCCGC